jgi:signal transduction histidine kinase
MKPKRTSGGTHPALPVQSFDAMQSKWTFSQQSIVSVFDIMTKLVFPTWSQIWRWQSLAVCLIVCFYCGVCQAAALPKSVLILNESGGPTIQGYLEITFAERSTLNSQSSSPFVTYIEDLDLNQFQGPEYNKTLLTYLREKYLDRPLGVIIANGAEALRLALQLRAEKRWSDIAIVFCAIDEGRLRSLLPAANVTGRFIQFSPNNSIIAARALVHDLKQIVVVGDPFQQQAFRGHFATELPRAVANLELIDLTGLPLAEVKVRVATLPESAAILYTAVTTDSVGHKYLPNEALEIIAKSANRPIVVDVDNRLGHGATGGFVVVPSRMGEEAARLVLRLFDGESASEIPVVASSALKPVFDWRELRRWAIGEGNLPPGSEIRFRAPTAWEQYWWQIVLLASVILTEAALIIGLLYERRRRRLAEIVSFQRVTELAHLNRLATAGELSASIAHEVKQPLAAMVAQTGAALRWLAQSAPNLNEARAALEKVKVAGDRAAQIIENPRAMFRKETNAHRPLNVNSLIENVLALCTHELQKNGISVQTTFSQEIEPKTLGDEAQLEQVFLNLIVNAIEAMSTSDTGPRTLQVKTAVNEADGVLITVADSGPGLDAKSIDKVFDTFYTTKPAGMGLGLSICRSIVESHSGRLSVSRGDRGLIFYVSLPVSSR